MKKQAITATLPLGTTVQAVGLPAIIVACAIVLWLLSPVLTQLVASVNLTYSHDTTTTTTTTEKKTFSMGQK